MQAIFARCSICREDLGRKISALYCGHLFHTDCIEKWFKTASSCPQCRAPSSRKQIVKRLYFDFAPTPNTLSEVNGVPLFDENDPLPDRSFLENARLEIKILNENIKNLQEDAQSTKEKLLLQDRELKTLTNLYGEVDKLYNAERQKYRNIKLELNGCKDMLKETEEIRKEVLQLRGQISEIRNTNILIGSSDNDAQDLLSRYTGSTDRATTLKESCDTHSLLTVCKWASVLRSELTSTREKARRYRIELHRLQKANSAAIQSKLAAEATANEYREHARQVEKELTSVLRSSVHATQQASADESISLDVAADVIATTSSILITPTNVPTTSPRYGIRTCLNIVDTTTPFLKSLEMDTLFSAKQPEAFTPFSDPFKLNSTMDTGTPQTKQIDSGKDVSSNSIKLMSATDQVKRVFKRPSGMLSRAFEQKYAEILKSPQIYNGYGFQDNANNSSCLVRQVLKKPTQHKPPMKIKHFSSKTSYKHLKVTRLDDFVQKH